MRFVVLLLGVIGSLGVGAIGALLIMEPNTYGRWLSTGSFTADEFNVFVVAVEKAGWSSGYGKQTLIRHANGYVTSYSHQTRIADFVKPGARVRQGQVIGWVGSTGLSTGPHLHYEVIVNGTKVDPMRIRLPKGSVLKGENLASFQKERDRIDDLLRDEEEGDIDLASAR